MLSAGVGARVGVAATLVAVLWLGVAWALT